MALRDGTEAEKRALLVTRWALLATALLLGVWSLQGLVLGDSANSRLATAVSLVHDGTWYIDRPWGEPRIPYERSTVDKAEVNGRLVSTKPPVMPLVMTGVYWIGHHVLGMNLLVEDDAYQIARWMAVLLSLIPYLLCVWFFSRFLDWFALAWWKKTWLLAALIGSTQLTSYSGQINNHVPGACGVLIALYLAYGLIQGHLAPQARYFIAFGLSSALVFAVDMPMTIFPAFLGLALLYVFPKQAFCWGALGAAPLLLIHFGVLYLVTGSPLPLQLYPEKYLFQGSFWRHPTGLDGLNEPKLTYLFHLSIGRHGAFLLFPVLLLGLAGLMQGILRKEKELRGWLWGATAALAILMAYYVFKTNNYGGAAYGFRWLIGAMPVLLLLAIPLLRRPMRPWLGIVLVVFSLVGAGSMIECLQSPWGEDGEWTVRYLFGSSF